MILVSEGELPERACIQAAETIQPKSFIFERPKIVLFGDSLTERGYQEARGWASGLTNVYARKADIVLRGFSGYNTRWALEMMDYIFHDATNVQLVTVFFGANDAAMPHAPGPHHIPLLEYKDNLKKIVEFLRKKGVKNIILITPPPVSEDGRRDVLKWMSNIIIITSPPVSEDGQRDILKWMSNVIFITSPPVSEDERRDILKRQLDEAKAAGMGLDRYKNVFGEAKAAGMALDRYKNIHGEEKAAGMALDRYNNVTKTYAESCKDLGSELNVPVVDLWSSMMGEKDLKAMMVKDGLHLSSAGNQHVFRQLLITLEKAYPSLKADDMASQFPTWKSFDPKDPAAFFRVWKEEARTNE
eukprot:gene29268-12509_t